MNWRRITHPVWIAGLACCLTTAHVGAWEADVHFGLTYWLALQAGFTPDQARIIATGDQRVESGDMAFVAPMFDYACVGTDEAAFARADSSHYPSANATPAPPSQRAVQAASASASSAVDKILISARTGKAPFLMQKLGEALHPLQDSWSHQGTVDVPPAAALSFSCDPNRVWAHSKERGGWNSHRADLTSAWSADTMAMARTTYAILTGYPEAGAKRNPRSWDVIAPNVEKFARASTKVEKASWFKASGVDDVSFLEGITLADGPSPFTAQWSGPKRPVAPTHQSRQPHIPADLLDFYHAFFAQWTTTTDFQSLTAKFGDLKGPGAADLATRLMGWRLRDHGRVAEILHLDGPIPAKDRKILASLAKGEAGLVTFDAAQGAYIPILPIMSTSEVSPLLPFVIRLVGDEKSNRAVAVVKLRHIPYDVLAVTAEKSEKGWQVVSVVSAVDH